MKVFNNRLFYFKELNEIISRHDWRHDNLKRYTNFFKLCLSMFKNFDYVVYEEMKLKLDEFKREYGGVARAEELLIQRAGNYKMTHFFKYQVPDENNVFGYRIEKKRFDYIELQELLDELVEWCNYSRYKLFEKVTVDFKEFYLEDKNTLEVIKDSENKVIDGETKVTDEESNKNILGQ